MIAKSRCAAAALLAALVWPAAAYAGVVSANGESVSFAAGSGETNHLHVTYGADSIAITDTGTPITAGPGCTSVTPEEAVCPVTALKLHVALGDLNDSLVATWTFGDGLCWVYMKGAPATREARFDGGTGDDTLESAASGPCIVVEFLDGGPGDDLLTDGLGGPRTYLDGGPGADAFEGEDATVVYADRVNPITVTTDGVANDGEIGEGDQVPSEILMVIGGAAGDTIVGSNNVLGGPGDDTLTGGPETTGLSGGPGNDTISVGASTWWNPWLEGDGGDDRLIGGSARDQGDYLYGGRGNDTLIGLAGCDDLYGGGGNDIIIGGEGSDRASGNNGSDLLYGGRGADAIYGGASRDRLFGGVGTDFLFARDLRSDRLDGGPGRDRAQINRGDIVRRTEALPPRLTEPGWMGAIPSGCYYTGS